MTAGMRDYISIVEAFTVETTGLAGWYNPTTGKSFLKDDGHAGIVSDNAEAFGLSPDELDDIWEDGTALDVVHAALQHGWVRINLGLEKHESIVSVEGGNLEDLRKTVRWMITQGMITDGVQIELTTKVGNEMAHRYFVLKDREVERFVRTGRV